MDVKECPLFLPSPSLQVALLLRKIIYTHTHNIYTLSLSTLPQRYLFFPFPFFDRFNKMIHLRTTNAQQMLMDLRDLLE